MIFGLDAVTKQRLSSAQVSAAVAHSVKVSFRVPDGIDPLAWISTEEARFAFIRRVHPEALILE
jgi:hypothetical protein